MIMDIKITPAKLNGHVDIPSSKSVAHRMLICASLAGNSEIGGISFSKDIDATVQAMSALGSVIYTSQNSVDIPDRINPPEKAVFSFVNRYAELFQYINSNVNIRT